MVLTVLTRPGDKEYFGSIARPRDEVEKLVLQDPGRAKTTEGAPITALAGTLPGSKSYRSSITNTVSVVSTSASCAR